VYPSGYDTELVIVPAYVPATAAGVNPVLRHSVMVKLLNVTVREDPCESAAAGPA